MELEKDSGLSAPALASQTQCRLRYLFTRRRPLKFPMETVQRKTDRLVSQAARQVGRSAHPTYHARKRQSAPGLLQSRDQQTRDRARSSAARHGLAQLEKDV